MKIIGSVKENLTIEKRTSFTPDTVKKFNELNFSIYLEKLKEDSLKNPKILDVGAFPGNMVVLSKRIFENIIRIMNIKLYPLNFHKVAKKSVLFLENIY